MASEKEQFVQTWDMEFATTLKVLRALPEGKPDFKPHPKAMSTRELAWHMVSAEKFFVEACLAGRIEPRPGPPAPATLGEILATAERQHRELVGKVQAADDRLLAKAIQMPVGPKQMGEVPTIKALWMGVVMHIVHHRGQLSVHLRMMGEKVPSIYGPSLDEPWF